MAGSHIVNYRSGKVVMALKKYGELRNISIIESMSAMVGLGKLQFKVYVINVKSGQTLRTLSLQVFE